MEERGLTAKALGKLAGIGERTVFNYLAGSSAPTSTNLQKLADALGVSFPWLVGGDEHPGSGVVRETPPEKPARKIPVVSYAQAGAGGNFDDLANQIDEWVSTDCRDPNCLAVIVEGQSMEPAWMPGDIAVVAPNAEPRNNDTVLARELESGNVWLKKFRLTGPNGSVVQLISFNPDYEPIERPRAAFRFIYPVVERKIRR
jgi:phage repressor protein C with HTH and peptisase S24 domain